MSEQESPSSVRQEGDGSETENHPAAEDREYLRRQVAEEISRQFPGLDHGAVLKQAASITRDLAGAEDVQQTFYLGLLRLSADQRMNIRSLDAYISGSVRNIAVRWRKKHRPSNHEGLDAEFIKENVDDIAERVADENEINFMLSQLPENCRKGFVYYFAEDYTAKEAAARLGITTESFKKRLQRSILELAAARMAYEQRRK
jgi:RNA polymerase sigma factor (sigma-70 family)